MQRRILVFTALIGALAGLVALILLLLQPGKEVHYTETMQPPAAVPAPPEDGLKARRYAGDLKGKVVDGLTGKPLPGARVKALKPYLKYEKGEDLPLWGELMTEKEVVTGADGTFLLNDLPKNYWNLWAERKGYAFSTVPRARFDVEHTIKLYPSCTLRGRVLLPDESPAVGVHIEYTPQGTHSEVFSRFRRKQYFTATDEQGGFTYTEIPPGKFTVEVYPKDYLPAPWLSERPLKPGENRDLGTHKLAGGFEIEVRVLWLGTNEPVSGVKVIVRPINDPMPRTKTGQTRFTDHNGVAHFTGLGGQVMEKPQFLVTADLGYGPVRPDEAGTFAPGARVTIHLRKDGTVKGKVVLPDGSPVDHFFVSLEAVGHMTRQLLVTGRKGLFTLYQVPEGKYILHVQHMTLVDAAKEITVAGGEETNAGVITLRQGAEIYGQVTRTGGKPIEGVVKVLISIKETDRLGREVYRTVGRTSALKNGTYSLKGVAPGRYYLQAEAVLDPSLTTEPIPVEIRPGSGGLQRNLVFEGRGYLKLAFIDLHDGEERRVVPPETYLVAENSSREIHWFGDGTPLKPGKYMLYVALKDDQGVSQRYKVREVRVQEGRSAQPIEIRLQEIR